MHPPKKDESAAKRKTPADWARIEKELDAELKKDDDDAAAAAGSSKRLDAVLQEIYAGADEDVRRAMTKSFVQSGGTVLSTDWRDVAENDYSRERQKYLPEQQRK